MGPPPAPRATPVPPAQPAAPAPAAPPVAIGRHRVEPEAPAASGERLELLESLLAAEKRVADADCAVPAVKRQRDRARANWEYVREQAVNPHRLAQLSTSEQWDANDKRCRSDMDASRARLLAAESAVGDAEEVQYWAKFEEKEARFELKEHDEERARKAEYEREKAESAGKWVQIAEGIRSHNACYNAWDAEYWEPDAREYLLLHSLWKLQPDGEDH